MNRTDAKKISEKITNDQLMEMLNGAKAGTIDWTKQSIVNKGLTKGVAWNILGKDFDVSKKYNSIVKINMIREFGEFLPNNIKPKRKEPKKITRTPFHQDPIF
jgi:hypothetical protein